MTRIVLALVATIVPVAAFAHVTITGAQPGPYKTAARTSYAFRVPNEKDKQNTIRIEVTVPEAVQDAISLRKVPGWKVKPTLQGSGEGARITAVTYVATKAAEIPPHFFEEFPIRLRNPLTAQSICFPVVQVYRGIRGGTEAVLWTGAPESDTPAPCLAIVD